jgi:arginase
MPRPIAVLGAPSSIGLRPDAATGEPQTVSRAPGVLRELRLIERLHATDLGDLLPPPYQDFTRPPGRARNEGGVAAYSLWLADRIAAGLAEDAFVLVPGGDCSIVLGCLLGVRRHAGRVGLAYIDAHADFATPGQSQTGSVASMGLALAVGHGDSPLATLAGSEPIVRPEHVVLIGRRDASEPSYGHAALGVSGILDLPDPDFAGGAAAPTAEAALERLGRDDLDAFWILVDADVLNPSEQPAVGSPEDGGPTFDDLAALLAPLVNHPNAVGMALTLYDPSLDPDLTCGGRLVTLLERVLGPGSGQGR